MTEAELRRRVVALAHAYGWLVFSLPIAKTRRPVKDAIGYPDLTLARNGRKLWLELKKEDGELSDRQREWHIDLRPDVYVVRPSDLGDKIEDLLGWPTSGISVNMTDYLGTNAIARRAR